LSSRPFRAERQTGRHGIAETFLVRAKKIFLGPAASSVTHVTETAKGKQKTLTDLDGGLEAGQQREDWVNLSCSVVLDGVIPNAAVLQVKREISLAKRA
jgi:hypothetical protein